MNKFFLYYKKLRLIASNNYLIELHTKLSSNPGEEDHNKLCQNRIEVRVVFNKQFLSCIEEHFNPNNPPLESLNRKILLHLFIPEIKFTISFSYPDMERCYYKEVDSLSNYYNILNTRNLPRKIFDLLLEQKRKIEGYLESSM